MKKITKYLKENSYHFNQLKMNFITINFFDVSFYIFLLS